MTLQAPRCVVGPHLGMLVTGVAGIVVLWYGGYRVMDGAPAARFLDAVRRHLEQPAPWLVP